MAVKFVTRTQEVAVAGEAVVVQTVQPIAPPTECSQFVEPAPIVSAVATTGRVSLKEFLAKQKEITKAAPVMAQSVRQALHELRESNPRKRLLLVNKVHGARYPVFEVDSDYNAYIHHEVRKFKFWLKWTDAIEAQYKPCWTALDGTPLE